MSAFPPQFHGTWRYLFRWKTRSVHWAAFEKWQHALLWEWAGISCPARYNPSYCGFSLYLWHGHTGHFHLIFYSCMTHVYTDRRQKNCGQTAQIVGTTFRWKVFNYFWWCCNYFDDIKKPLLSCLSSQSWYFSVNYLLVSNSVKRLDSTRERGGAWTAANIYNDCQLFLMTGPTLWRY